MARKTLFLVVQQGGSTGEWYASTYNYREDAVDAIEGHAKATYHSVGPFEIPAELTKAFLHDARAETQFNGLVNEVCRAVATKDFAG